MKAKEIKNVELIAKVIPHNMTYPKSGFKAGDFAIVKFDVVEVISGEIPEECVSRDSLVTGKLSYLITVKGNMPQISYVSEYILRANMTIDKTWGPQYDLVSLRLNYNLKDPAEQRKFFSFFMTENQVSNLFEQFANPLDLLENKNIGELTKVKGIGNVVAIRMCERYEACKDNSQAYVALKDLDLTKNAIDKLIKIYGNADLVISKINTNPYTLSNEVSGYGWKKCDAIAMKRGFTKDCRFRVEAYTKFYLEQQAEINGNSWVKIEDLLTSVSNECSPVTNENLTNWIKEMMIGPVQFTAYFDDLINGKPTKSLNEMPILFYEPEKKKVGLLKLRLMEKQIARHFKRLKDAKPNVRVDPEVCNSIIKECEKKQGFSFTEEQTKGIFTILNNNVSILTGGAGCVDGEAEFLTSNGWKKIKDYQYGDKVLQYNEDGTTTFVTPEIYHKEPCDKMYHFETKYGINQKITPDHNVVTISPKGVMHINTMEEIKDAQENKGFRGRFITGFNYSGGEGVPYHEDELRLIIAAIADGSISKRTMRFNIKKDRKKERLEELLRRSGYQWNCKASSVQGYSRYCVYMPLIKVFPQEWYSQLSAEQMEIIVDELKYWDGSIDYSPKGQVERIKISSSVKENADFIQFIYASCGYHASLGVRDRRNQLYNNNKYTRKSLEYSITVSKNTLTGFCVDNKNVHTKTAIVEEETSDGYKYCFTVPSHMWVMRYNNCIVVTGNCGKTSTLLAVSEILKHYHQDVQQCALSGRAASKLTEVTHIQGKTIHRLLNYIPDRESFMYTERNQMPADVVILDETSMVGGEIFLSLIQAIRSGSKFIMVGDHKQLEAIGLANILKDCLASAYIPSVVLTKIHRQAAASGIITQSLNMSNGEKIVKDDFVGEEIRGELKDFKLVTSFKPDFVPLNIIKEFKKLYLEQHIPADNIQVIVPMRLRGNISCVALNNQIQEIVNPGVSPHEISQTYVENGSQYKVSYKPKDRIIIVKNNYRALSPDGKEKAIFNGNLGHIVDIYNDSMLINVDGIGEVILTREQWFDINLAYAITCHKLQGSQSPYCIVGLNTSCYSLYSREWLYTAVTRAQKYCVLVTQPSSINQAVRISHVKTKQTWLQPDLLKYHLDEEGE